MEIDPGTVVANRYRILRPLGRGGMGEVYAAENIRTGRPVAVKLLHAESKQKSSAVERFRREARAAGSINSDHVTQVLDVEEDDEYGIALVFELLEGESLIDRLKRTGPIPFDEVHVIVEQVWIGLVDAHKAGVIHRDLKPSNVFLERRPDGTTRVKILDFGISKLPKEMGGDTLTEMGQSLGTFSFMPPEQIGKAKTVDHRADIYAVATLVFQALSGQLPYAARNILVMVEMKGKTDARPLSEAVGEPVGAQLEQFLATGLARDPNRRYQTAADALNAWRELRSMPAPWSPRRPISSSSMPAARPPSNSQPAIRLSVPSQPPGARPPSGSQPAVRMPSQAPGARPPSGSQPAVRMPSQAPGARPPSGSHPAVRLSTPSQPPGARPPSGSQPAVRVTTPPQPFSPTVPNELGSDAVATLAMPVTPLMNHALARGGTSIMEMPKEVSAMLAHATAAPVTEDAPPSRDKTTLVRAKLPSVKPPGQPISVPPGTPSRASLARGTPVPPTRPSRPAKKSALPYVFGALVFALVGFAIVAFILQYLRVGALRFH